MQYLTMKPLLCFASQRVMYFEKRLFMFFVFFKLSSYIPKGMALLKLIPIDETCQDF